MRPEIAKMPVLAQRFLTHVVLHKIYSRRNTPEETGISPDFIQDSPLSHIDGFDQLPQTPESQPSQPEPLISTVARITPLQDSLFATPETHIATPTAYPAETFKTPMSKSCSREEGWSTLVRHAISSGKILSFALCTYR
jgi:hypothetical protein